MKLSISASLLIFSISAAQVTKLPLMKTVHAIAFLKKHLPLNPIIVEAGAFEGQDSIKLAQTWPKAAIYSFEPVPQIFERLQNQTKSFPQITCYQLALGTKSGTANFITSEEPKKPDIPSMSGSLRMPKEHLNHSKTLFKKSITVNTITLDEWAQKNNINKIDLLWLDTQGTELDILRASPLILKNIGVIYTEVEFVEAYEGQALYADVKNFLENNGFQMIARDFDEPARYWFGNAVFIKQ